MEQPMLGRKNEVIVRLWMRKNTREKDYPEL